MRCSAEDELTPCITPLQLAKLGVDRWKPGMTFGQFAELTVQDYYPEQKI